MKVNSVKRKVKTLILMSCFVCPTIFLRANFDKNVDKSVGGGSIHITPGTALQ